MIFKPKKCSMKGCGGCGWVHMGEKLRKTHYFVYGYGDKYGIFSKILSKLSTLSWNRGFGFLSILHRRTEYVCEHHWLISEFGLVRTKNEKGIQCFMDIKDLHIPYDPGAMYWLCDRCGFVETMPEYGEKPCWSCGGGNFTLKKVAKSA